MPNMQKLQQSVFDYFLIAEIPIKRTIQFHRPIPQILQILSHGRVIDHGEKPFRIMMMPDILKDINRHEIHLLDDQFWCSIVCLVTMICCNLDINGITAQSQAIRVHSTNGVDDFGIEMGETSGIAHVQNITIHIPFRNITKHLIPIAFRFL